MKKPITFEEFVSNNTGLCIVRGKKSVFKANLYPVQLTRESYDQLSKEYEIYLDRFNRWESLTTIIKKYLMANYQIAVWSIYIDKRKGGYRIKFDCSNRLSLKADKIVKRVKDHLSQFEGVEEVSSFGSDLCIHTTFRPKDLLFPQIR